MRMLLSVLACLVLLASSPVPAADAAEMTIYRNAGCGCCGKWAEHMRAAGHSVTIVDGEDMSVIKVTHAIPDNLHSCHTALVEGYVIEGHVPAEDVARLLAEKPAIKGIAVAGMPIGSPGMETGDGSAESYDVMAFDGAGSESVFASH